MKNHYIAALLMATTISLATENNNISGTDTKSINADMQECLPITSGMMMDDVFEQYRKERNIAAYGMPNKKGTVYFTGSATVAANADNADFIKSRSMAYQNAYNDAVAKLVMDRFGREITKKTRQRSADYSTDAQAAPANLKDTRSSLERKTEALSEAEIDQKLQEMGVDPKEYSDKSIAAKKELYRNSIVEESLKKAFGSAAGCLVVQTFETRTADGVYTIGVVLRSDAICTELARCISQKQRPLLSSKSGISVKDALPSDEELLTQFGVRIFFDENGEPCLLSFGQWGTNYTGNDPRELERSLEHAKEQAEKAADQQLTDFINSTMRVTETSMRGEEVVKQMLFAKDGTVSEEDIRKSIDKLSSSSVTVGYDSTIGRSTIMSKPLRHPAGHYVCVAIRTWSFGKLDAEKAAIYGKPATPPQKAESPKIEESGVRKGRTYDF